MRSITLALAAGHFLLSSAFLIVQAQPNTLVFDAEWYFSLAQTGGATLQADPSRTWGYPWFLGITLGFADFLGASPIVLTWLAQTAIYIASSAFLARSFKSQQYCDISFAVLMINVLVAPYHSVLLTDSLSTSLALLVIGACLRLSSSNTLATTLVLCLGFSFAVAVRPSSVWLAPLVVFYFLFVFFKDRKSLIPRLGVLSFGLIPLIVQSFLNMKSFSRMTPLPTGGLGGSQIGWGIENFKYATTIQPELGGIFYRTTSLLGQPGSEATFGWYFSNPFLGIQLLLIKLVSAFDWDYLVPYITDPESSSFLGLGAISLLVFGLFFSVLNFASKGLDVQLKLVPIIVFLGWAAVILPSSIELRFVIPMALFFGVITAIGFYRLWQISKKRVLLVAVIGLTVVGALVPIALFVRGTMVLPG
jgi:hypothetical protein